MNTKTAMITIAGRPNVGKSTLANALVGEKIAIVSHKPQTTRNRICAIVDRGDTQIVFIDTPGFHRPRTKLGDYMVNVVNQSVADVDAVILLVEPIANVGPQEQELIEKIREAKVPAILVINKIDTVEKETLLPVIAAYKDLMDFTDVIPISAKWHDGLDSLMQVCESFAQPGPISSYRTLEARMMVCRSLPIVPPSVRAPRAARPMATPAWGMSASPR